MPAPNAREIVMSGGSVSSSEVPSIHLIPTEAIVRLAARCDVGVERKQDKAWNALAKNNDCLTDERFILHRITHVITHALRLRDKIARGLVGTSLDTDDDAGAIIWGGAFLCCATKAIRDSRDNRDELATDNSDLAKAEAE